QLFGGNSDSTTLVTNTLAISTNMRFVRFIPTRYNRFKALRIELFGFCQDCTQPLGMENQGILSTAMTSSSEIDGSHSASAGRLYGGSSWCSATSSSSEYLQVDLGRVVRVTGIATQGSPDEDKWASQYRLSYSNDSNTWTTVTSDFAGNVDGNGVRVNWLSPQIRSRFIKVHVQSWNTAVCMRLEIHGCESKRNCDIPVGVADGTIPDANLTASSTSNSSALVSTARLNYAAGPSWCAGSDDISPFFEVDLGTIHVICAVATQGSADSEDWIQSFRLAGAQDGLTWKKYTEDGKVKLFGGNSDSTTLVTNTLAISTNMRFVRFIPTRYNRFKALRIELFGFCQGNPLSCDIPVGVADGTIPDANLTASSTSNSSALVSTARLNYAAGPSWCAGSDDFSPFFEVDLGTIHVICAVATQGSADSEDWIQSYRLAGAQDGLTWKKYTEDGKVKTFLANTDQDSVVTNVLQSPVAVKMLRIYPVEYSGYKCMRLEVYGYKQGRAWKQCQQALGIENKGIRDEQMTTSSKQDDSHGASAGRLYAGSSWCSATSSSSEYLQVDLGRVAKVTGIATQGSPTEDKWVMTYALSHSNNGEDWVEYKAGQNILKVCPGNSDGSRVAVNWLQYPFMSRHVRVTPQTWRNAICLRVDFYGCAVTCDKHPVGLANLEVPDSNITASSVLNITTPPSQGRLNSLGGSWCANTTDTAPYLQVDLGTRHVICAVSTQGSPSADQWVQSYEVHGSLDGVTWVPYKERIFNGNTDKTTVVKRTFSMVTAARYVRVNPMTFQGYKQMRVELYGCRQGKSR
ncbi:predicted protein, partial [Nematostella vectensis]